MGCLKKIYQHHKLISPLKLSLSGVLSMRHENIIPLTRYRNKQISNIDVSLWAMFDSDNFDGIHIVSFLTKDNEEMLAGSASFDIYSISNDGLFTETLITSDVGTLSGNKFLLSVPSIDFGVVDLSGETTLLISANLVRQGVSFKKKIYVNHLGIFESFFKLKKEVQFLNITKVDE